MCGRLRVGKDFLHVAGLVGAAMCSAFRCGSHGPLAIMPSADQVPVNNTHSITMRWHKWVVLIAGSTGSALRAVRPPNLHITPVAQRDLVLPRKRSWIPISFPFGHHGPGHPRNLI